MEVRSTRRVALGGISLCPSLSLSLSLSHPAAAYRCGRRVLLFPPPTPCATLQPLRPL
jgi:hypothetical protein